MTEQSKKAAFELFRNNPYAKLIGLEMIDIDFGQATLQLKMRTDLEQVHGLMHGGATASLIDTATGFAVGSVLAKDERAATIDLTLHYLRPITEGTITCIAKVVKNGRRFLTLSAEASNGNGKLVATALSTYTKL
jgi:acyl-CoA thioesterase